MVSNPLVSIVIPVYNGANYMREAIDSALAQTYGNIEILVINDGSRDNTEEIALSYGDKIRYFRKENGGVATALNLGIREMRGEYFSWLSHDDLYYPNKVEAQIDALRQCGDMTRLVYSSYTYLEQKTQMRQALPPAYFNPRWRTKSIAPIIAAYINGCTLLIHKSHFEATGVFDEALRNTQDYDLWFRMLRGKELLFVEQPLVVSRVHGLQGSIVNEDFTPEVGALHEGFSEAIPAAEQADLFGSRYIFYLQICKALINQDKSAYARIRQRMDACDNPFAQPEHTSGFRQFLLRLSDLRADKLCIYCAGGFGRKLKLELDARAIPVHCFGDNSPAKQGKVIDGAQCLSLGQLEPEKGTTLVIVANRIPTEIIRQLKDAGFPHVVSYYDVLGPLFDSIPHEEGAV